MIGNLLPGSSEVSYLSRRDPSFLAVDAASVRVRAPSFASTAETWWPAVFSVM
jgi:hypothetical protein